jgi:hypothetical protein
VLTPDLGARLRRSAAAMVSALAVGAGAGPAEALLLVYEPFAYDAGILDGALATGQNLTGNWVGSPVPPGFDLVAVEPGLDTGSLVGAPAPAGNRLSQELGTTSASVTAQIDADVAVAPGDAIFFSALFRFDDSLNGNHLANLTLSDPSSGDAIELGQATVGGRSLGIAVQTAGTGGQLIADRIDQAFTDGDVLFVIGRYVNSASALGDTLELIAYDTADADVLPNAFTPGDPNAEHAFLVDELDIDLGSIGAATFSIRGTGNNFVDELRIGTSYADVALPEPSAGLLLGAAVASSALARARSRS